MPRNTGRLVALLAVGVVCVVCGAVIVGCGGRRGPAPSIDALPVASGLHVQVEHNECLDPTTCWRIAVLTDGHGRDEPALLNAERQALLARGWRPIESDPGVIGLRAPDRTVEAFLQSQRHYLRENRRNGNLVMELTDRDFRQVPRRMVLNERARRPGLWVSLEFPPAP
jgi:hypothetical protein